MRKEFFYGTMALGMVFTACKSDDLTTPGNEGVESNADRTLYVSMAIRGDVSGAGTRSGSTNGNPDAGTDFENGTDESAVQNAYFVFYDADGNVVGDVVQVNLNGADVQTGVGADGTTVEKYYKSVVSVGLRAGQTASQVICYINPVTPAALQNPLSTIQTITREEVVRKVGETTKYFPMSNSVYYAPNAASPTIAVSVENKLYDTYDEAAADGAESIDIYVERYASKLKFSTVNADDYITSSDLYDVSGVVKEEAEVVLSFNPERWAVNAEANETYVIKSFRQASVTGQILADNYTWAEADAAINSLIDREKPLANGTVLQAPNNWVWNNSDLKRSFWACSPAYYTEAYPEVASDVDQSQLRQTYYSYKDLEGGAGYAWNNVDAQYFRETTVGRRALAAGNPRAAIPSVILVGKYSISVGGKEIAGNPTFYTYQKGTDGKSLIYFDNDVNSVESSVEGGYSMLGRFINQLTCLYKQVTTRGQVSYVHLDPANADDLAILVSNLVVADPTDEVTGEMKVAARYRTLQFAPNANTSGIYVAAGNGYQAIGNNPGEISLVDANRAIMQQVGFCEEYNMGKAYFNIPVLHYGWYRQGNENKGKADIEWSKVMVGDFGMVRNHSYTINVSKIENLGYGIGGDNDPIVPPADLKDQYISYRVNILQWAVVPAQNVEL